MGLSIYAGTVNRYLNRDWQTVDQLWAIHNGYKLENISADSGDGHNQKEIASKEEVQELVKLWQEHLIRALNSSMGTNVSPWPEKGNTPYFTDKPDWDAFGAMLMVAACCSLDIDIPKSVPKNWDFRQQHPIKTLAENKDNDWLLLKEVDWWLPIEGSFCFMTTLPNNKHSLVGTIEGLEKELIKLNELAWKADEQTIMSWSRSEGYEAGEQKLNNEGNIEYDTQSLAKYAYSILYQAVMFAKHFKVPIMMDY